MSQQLDLLSLFKTVSHALEQNRDQLNSADSYNGDHGDNMVQIFSLVSQVIGKNSSAAPAEQLLQVGQTLKQQKSGSAQVYGDGFLQAAEKYQNTSITKDNVMGLIQTLMGGGKAALQEPETPLANMLSGLLGGQEESHSTIDAGDLLEAGLSFFSAKKRGENTKEALLEAVTSSSIMGEVPHRAQSSQVVVSTLLENLGSLIKK